MSDHSLIPQLELKIPKHAKKNREYNKASLIRPSDKLKISRAGKHLFGAELTRVMKTSITFQYKPEGKRPDDVTVMDVPSPLTAGEVVPGISDIVTLQIASNLREFQDALPGDYKSFQVIGRNFIYTTEDGSGSGKAVGCSIFVIVTDVPDDVPRVDIKE